MRRVAFTLLGGLLVAWLASRLVPYDVVGDVDPGRAGLGAAPGHWLGTDHLGRDVALRLLLGTQACVGPGLVAALIAGGLGGLAGAGAGWFGGPVEGAVRTLFVILGALPRLVVVLLACTILGGDVGVLAVAVGVASAPEPGGALLARFQALRAAEFVLAAEAHGIPPARVFWYHLLWVNGRAVLLRQMAQAFGFFVVIESTLSYLGGFGVQEPTPSWGNMLAFEFGVVDGNLWAWLAPALCLWLTAWGAAALAGEAGGGRG